MKLLIVYKYFHFTRKIPKVATNPNNAGGFEEEAGYFYDFYKYCQ